MLIIARIMLIGLLWLGLTEASAQSLPARPDGQLHEILQRGTLVVGVKTDYAPWGFLRSDGAPDGLEIDLARDLAERMGVKLRLVAVTASNRINRVNQGQVDLVIATTGDTVERRAQADLLQPNYYSSGVVLYGRRDLDVTQWENLRGQTICLNRAAYSNRALEERYGIKGAYFASRREALLALSNGRCVGWAFDDTALVRHMRDHPSDDLDVMLTPILPIRWSIIAAQGEGDRTLGRFVSAVIGTWHRTGFIRSLEEKWAIPPTEFTAQQMALWQSGACDQRPEDCDNPDPYESAPDIQLTGWMARLKTRTGIDLGVFKSDYERARLLKGLGLTLAISALAIVGAIGVGIGFALVETMLRGWGIFGQMLLVPQRLLTTVARMTPPILQLYIVFFGLGGLMLGAPELTPGAFIIACLIFSLYAGASNAVMLAHALAQERAEHPDTALLAILPGALGRCFDGLVSTCVNIIKAAGLASTIAVAEIVSSVNLLVADGADATALMNGLLIFYFLFVTLVIWLFRRVKTWVGGT